MARNPFTPTFGKIPPTIAGRRDVLDAMERAFDDGPGNPNLSSLLVGPRGSGKTVLLTLIADVAREHGWIAAKASALPGMLDDIIERCNEAADEFIDQERRLHVTGVGIPQILEINLARQDEAGGNWRTRMNRLLDELAKHGIGLLITVDEVRADIDEMIQLASVYQHFVQEDRKVALVMAGLPYHINKLVDNESVSFLRRARRQSLGRISDAEIENALRKTIIDAGGSIDAEALESCSKAAEGFPYMMQLVGFWTWESSTDGNITADDAARGIRQARSEIRTGVLDATFRELSDGDLRFLTAMLDDEHESKLSDISARMGVKSNYASKYKSRLLDRGVITDRGQGYLAFDLPGFRDYLLEKRS